LFGQRGGGQSLQRRRHGLVPAGRAQWARTTLLNLGARMDIAVADDTGNHENFTLFS